MQSDILIHPFSPKNGFLIFNELQDDDNTSRNA